MVNRMANVPAGAATSTTTKLPAPLTTAKRWWSALLVVLGCVLVVGVLVWFGFSTDGGGLKSKEATTSEPVGQQASGMKTSKTTDYADTIVIFALTAGAAFVLSGAFYGRLRELKLGALTIGLGELAPEKQQELDDKVSTAVSSQLANPQQRHVATVAAQTLARKELKDRYWGVMPAPPEETVDEVATTAAQQAVSAFD